MTWPDNVVRARGFCFHVVSLLHTLFHNVSGLLFTQFSLCFTVTLLAPWRQDSLAKTHPYILLHCSLPIEWVSHNKPRTQTPTCFLLWHSASVIDHLSQRLTTPLLRAIYNLKPLTSNGQGLIDLACSSHVDCPWLSLSLLTSQCIHGLHCALMSSSHVRRSVNISCI